MSGITRILKVYQVTETLGAGSYGKVLGARHLLTGADVAIKIEMPNGQRNEVLVLPYEAAVYRHLVGYPSIPRMHWFGMDGGANILIMDKLGANLQQLRRFCLGRLSLKTVSMLAEQMIGHIEFVHSRGVIYRDLKPENFAMGLGKLSSRVHLFDFGLAKMYVNPGSKQHIPSKDGLPPLGTIRYISHNVHAGCEQGRRDDMLALGHVLLFLLHGRLPWQGIYAPSVEAKLKHMGEMKAGDAMQKFLKESPPEFGQYFEHCRSLTLEDRPDYDLLRELFREIMRRECWEYDSGFDWTLRGRATLLPEEYELNARDQDPEQYLMC